MLLIILHCSNNLIDVLVHHLLWDRFATIGLSCFPKHNNHLLPNHCDTISYALTVSHLWILYSSPCVCPHAPYVLWCQFLIHQFLQIPLSSQFSYVIPHSVIVWFLFPRVFQLSSVVCIVWQKVSGCRIVHYFLSELLGLSLWIGIDCIHCRNGNETRKGIG